MPSSSIILQLMQHLSSAPHWLSYFGCWQDITNGTCQDAIQIIKKNKAPRQLSERFFFMYLQNCIQEIYIFLPSYRLGYALDRLVTVSSMCYHTSTSALSTSSSSRGRTTFVGISHLEGGFTLRCLQRLSLPGLATLPCSW